MARRHNKTGRTSTTPRHVRIYRSMMTTPAWKSLRTAEKAVLIEIYALYNGSNNGDLFLSCREAARRCNINKDTASLVMTALEEKGFIRRRFKVDVDWSLSQARCWVLTDYPFPEGTAPTKEYQHWRPSTRDDVSPIIGQADPENRTKHLNNNQKCPKPRDKLPQIIGNASTKSGHR